MVTALEIGTIRTAGIEDAPAISSLILAGSYDGVGIEGSSDELLRWQRANASITLIEQRITEPNTLVLVVDGAKDDLGLLATAYAKVENGEGYLGGLYCGLRGQALGPTLVSYLVNWLTTQGAPVVEMTIARHNVAMNTLSAKHGFVLESEFDNDQYFATSGVFGRWFLRTTESH
jgi:RimJ/RimL family protein N-acetyltransferase